MVEFMRTLLKVNVFIFDYSGYGLSRGTPSEEQFYRDGQDAIDFVESRNDLGKTVYISKIGYRIESCFIPSYSSDFKLFNDIRLVKKCKPK